MIAAGPGEWRAAWLEDGVAVELHVERGDSRPAGSLHLGRVLRRVSGLDAALVDIGDERPGFLPFGRAPAGGQPLAEGARVVVEIRREAQGGKGALLSARILRPEADLDHLAALAAAVAPPFQLDPPGGFAAALARRLPGSPGRVTSDDIAILAELRAAFPAAELSHRGDWPVDLDGVFAVALSPTLALADGGSIHIEEAHAAVLIDVDSGSPEAGSAGRAVLAANLAAATAIARQLRLRQIGGGIVVDFAALEGSRARERVRGALAAALAGDPAQPQVLGWTRLGHLELVRPRRGRPLSAAMLEGQPARKSAATLAFEALRAVYREARARPSATWRLAVAPNVAAALKGPAAAGLRALETRLGRAVAVAIAPELAGGEAFDIAPRHNDIGDHGPD